MNSRTAIRYDFTFIVRETYPSNVLYLVDHEGTMIYVIDGRKLSRYRKLRVNDCHGIHRFVYRYDLDRFRVIGAADDSWLTENFNREYNKWLADKAISEMLLDKRD